MLIKQNLVPIEQDIELRNALFIFATDIFVNPWVSHRHLVYYTLYLVNLFINFFLSHVAASKEQCETSAALGNHSCKGSIKLIGL